MLLLPILLVYQSALSPLLLDSHHEQCIIDKFFCDFSKPFSTSHWVINLTCVPTVFRFMYFLSNNSFWNMTHLSGFHSRTYYNIHGYFSTPHGARTVRALESDWDPPFQSSICATTFCFICHLLSIWLKQPAYLLYQCHHSLSCRFFVYTSVCDCFY